MAHFAEVVDGIVTQVIVAEQDFIDSLETAENTQWIKTSYNVKGGIYYDPETNEPVSDQSIIDGDEARQRKNFAAIGFLYDLNLDAFIPPKPFASWTLDEASCLWISPVPYPEAAGLDSYQWNENSQTWDLEE